MVKAVFFDLDGTLVNTVVDLGAAVHAVLKEHGIAPAFTEADYKQMVGNGAMALLERAFQGAGQPLAADQKPAVLTRFKAIYSSMLFDHTAPYEGIRDLLGWLKAQGYLLAVITNKPNANAQQMVRHYFAKGTFDYVSGQQEGIPAKPDPAQVNLALGQMELRKKDAVYIGDSDTDIQTAQNAGLISIGADWGFRGEKELLREGANYIAYHPFDIQKILQKL